MVPAVDSRGRAQERRRRSAVRRLIWCVRRTHDSVHPRHGPPARCVGAGRLAAGGRPGHRPAVVAVVGAAAADHPSGPAGRVAAGGRAGPVPADAAHSATGRLCGLRRRLPCRLLGRHARLRAGDALGLSRRRPRADHGPRARRHGRGLDRRIAGRRADHGSDRISVGLRGRRCVRRRQRAGVSGDAHGRGRGTGGVPPASGGRWTYSGPTPHSAASCWRFSSLGSARG